MTSYTRQLAKGFSLVEMLILLGIFSFFIGLIAINLSQAQQTASLSAAMNTLTSDLRAQQLKAMVGDTSGDSQVDNYGIFLSTHSYTLFRGTYSAGNAQNIVIDLPENTQIVATTFPGAQAIFLKGSGENSAQATNTITLQDANDLTQKTITINRYGVVE
ncbi:MAG: hypothetical protein AAB553_08150 [Patescibacteria group bacterium]